MLETLQDVSRELSWEERDEGERGGDGEGEGERTVSTRRKKSYRKSHSVGSRQQLKGCLFRNALTTAHEIRYLLLYS